MMQNSLKFIIICLVFTGCIRRVNTSAKIEKDWEDFSGVHIKMKGVVYFVNNNINKGNFHGRGITRINILETNTKSYDPRGKQLNYYCIIKNNNKAELYDNHADETSIGDTIEIDTDEKTIKWLNSNKSKQIYSISNGEIEFFDYVKENNLQEF
jgi:hypothetical protein